MTTCRERVEMMAKFRPGDDRTLYTPLFYLVCTLIRAQQFCRLRRRRLKRNAGRNPGLHPKFHLALNGRPMDYQRIARVAPRMTSECSCG